jgi:hypothetical protein
MVDDEIAFWLRLPDPRFDPSGVFIAPAQPPPAGQAPSTPVTGAPPAGGPTPVVPGPSQGILRGLGVPVDDATGAAVGGGLLLVLLMRR